MRTNEGRLPQVASAELPPACPAPFASRCPGSEVLCLSMNVEFCAKRNCPDIGCQAGGVEGLPPEFSLTFSCLTKDCPRLGFLPRGSSSWMERTSLFQLSRRVSVFFSPRSLHTDLLDETCGGKLLEIGIGERGLWGHLNPLKGAFGGAAERGWEAGLEQASCTSAGLTFEQVALF